MDQAFCCERKRYYSFQTNLTETLDITPRVVTCGRNMKIGEVNEQIVTIKNNGIFPRPLKYSSNSPTEITFNVPKEHVDRFLEPTHTVEIAVCVKPRKIPNSDINRQRSIFIESEHPNIIFEVPIVVTRNLEQPSYSTFITFPRCVLNTESFYELILFNPLKTPVTFTMKSTFKHLFITKTDPNVQKMNFSKVLLTLAVKSLKPQVGELKLKFMNAQYKTLSFEHHPISMSLAINVSHLDFSQLKYEREDKKEIIICNESTMALEYDLKLLSKLSELTNEVVHSNGHISTANHEFTTTLSEPSIGVIAPQASYDSFRSLSDDGEEYEGLHAQEVDKFDLCNYKHFQLSRTEVRLDPSRKEQVTVTFRPCMDAQCEFDDDLEPPFKVKTKIFVTVYNELGVQRKSVIVTGYIMGPPFEVTPANMDFRSIYLGEEHCREIKVRNVDGQVPGFIYFKEYLGEDDAIVTVTPQEGYHLESCRSNAFSICLFTRTIGKFIVRLKFKVKNGRTYTVVLRGDSRPLQLSTFPDVIEFGTIPICVPQKRFVRIINPLYAPVCIQVRPSDDGEETPLVLNVERIEQLPPITVNDPIKHFAMHKAEAKQINEVIGMSDEDRKKLEAENDGDEECVGECECECEGEDECEEEEESCRKGDGDSVTLATQGSAISYRSINDEASTYSTEFEQLVLETVPQIAEDIRKHMRFKKLHDKKEYHKTVVACSVNGLLSTGYFDDFTENQNYAFMDWNALPSDPKEIYYDSEIIYLRPNKDREIAVILIPNKPGYFHRALEVRICPYSHRSEDQPSAVIDSEMMVTKIWLEYHCMVPLVEWLDTIKFDSTTIYCGQEYEFDMIFHNNSSVAGFFFYDVVPDGDEAVMTFRNDIWKFYIKPTAIQTAECCVLFREFGYIKVPGMIKIVGERVSRTFTLEANVLPTAIRLFVKEIVRRQNVLENTETYIFIDNATPTITRIKFTLKNERFQYIEPMGAILGPGQGMYVTLHSKFYDPQMYYNHLTINLLRGRTSEIPIAFNVVNMPIIFDPNIRGGLDAGNIIVNSKENYDANLPKYKKDILVYNKGHRSYKLIIQKIKNTDKRCVAEIVKARFTISLDPSAFVLTPGSINIMHITADAYDETELYNEFRITIVDLENKQRFHNIRFVVRAKFIQPELLWNRKEISVTYHRSHKFKEHIILDLAELTNIADISIEDVVLKVFGPFRIKLFFEEHYAKELRFGMDALEKKDVFVVLNKGGIKDEYCKVLTGRITSTANGKMQRTLPLKVSIFNPQLIISTPSLMLFTDNYESVAKIILDNVGCLDAEYKWVKIREVTTYVEAYDDATELAHDILSDIFRMLELNPIEDDPPSDYVNEQNLTLRYQRYRCRLRRIEDPIGIFDLINEIIDNLDLEHKRYMLTVDDLDEVSLEQLSLTPVEEPSSAKECVDQTLTQVLKLLNIEDSYEVTPPSRDDCMMQVMVYFYVKSGKLPVKCKEDCLIHLPAVRKGHEIKATFELQVVGAQPIPFVVTLVNLSKTIELSKQSIYLGTRPWYESYKAHVNVRNITQYSINVRVMEDIRNSRYLCNRIHEGTVNISDKYFILPELSSRLIRFNGIMGFRDEFIRNIKFDVNESDEVFLRLRGQGVMPILSMKTKLGHLTQEEVDILLEYQLLQRIYYFDVFASIIEDDEIFGGDEENKKKLAIADNESDSMYDISSVTTSSSGSEHSLSVSERHMRRERRFFRLMQTYVIVNNNEELPNAMVLEQLVETEKFVNLLKDSMEACYLLDLVYQEYLKILRSCDKKMPINLKYFTIQPLPFEVHGYKLDLEDLKLNQFKRYEVNLQFFGPGKLIAAVRSVIKIPGLLVDFEVSEIEDKKFIYYNSEEKQCSLFCKPYRNMYEREMDAERDPMVKHAHSFDHSANLKHLRSIPNKDRKNVLNYYNSLNKSVYADRKHHFILCKIFSNWDSNYTGTNVKLVILIKPDSQFYDDGQLLEDYIYVDLHTGPTLPILLRGMITK